MPPSSDSSPSSSTSSTSRRRDVTGRREDAERDRQVERRARFADVGRREVDGDAVRREFEAGVADGAADAIAALADARVRQAHHRERGQAERHVDLDVHRARLDAEDRGGPHTRQHTAAWCKAARSSLMRIGFAEKTEGRCATRKGERAGIAVHGPALTVADCSHPRSRQRALARIFSFVPAAIELPCSRFQLLILATVVSNSSRDRRERVAALDAIDDLRDLLRGRGLQAPARTTDNERDATAFGAARSARAASSVAGARGMISS